MPALFLPLIQWLTSGLVVKFFITSAIFAVLALLFPVLLTYLGDWINTAALNTAFSQFTPAIWYFVDLFQFGYGLPLLISAAVTRFLIRRLPFIG